MVRTELFETLLNEKGGRIEAVRDELLRVDPLIRPDGLGTMPGWIGEMYGGFYGFEVQESGSRLWAKRETWQMLEDREGREGVVLVFFCGPPGAGKDFVVSWLQKEHPELAVKVVTTASRKSREGEVNGDTYVFLEGGMEEFMGLVKPGEGVEVSGEQRFLEYEVHKDGNGVPYRGYGMQVGSLMKALADPRPVMYAMTDIAKQVDLVRKMGELVPDLGGLLWLSVFVGPAVRMSDYLEQLLPLVRPDDHELRGLVAIEELWLASVSPNVLWVENVYCKDEGDWLKTTLEPLVALLRGLLQPVGGTGLV